MHAHRAVAAAVVLVLAGAPVAASACALWCPPAAAGDARSDVAREGASSAEADCAAQHRHAADPPLADRESTAVAADARTAADALASLRSTPIPMASLRSAVCCDVPVPEVERAAVTVQAPPLPDAPPASPLHPANCLVPPRARAAAASSRPAGIRPTRALVLRI